MNDFDTKIKALLNESVDADLGPRRPAPPFDPAAAQPSRRRFTPWLTPLLAAASVLLVVGATVTVAHIAGSGTQHHKPATSVSPTVEPLPTGPTTPSTATGPSGPPATGPKASLSSSAAAPGTSRAAGVLDFGGYGPVDLGMEASQVAAVEPQLTRSNFGSGCTQFVGQSSGGVGGPMFNVVLTPPTNRVIGISVPAEAVTDTGIRVGSTRAQVRAAYAGHTIVAQNSQGGQVLLVQGTDSWFGFLFGAGPTVKSMHMGSRDFAAQNELCVG